MKSKCLFAFLQINNMWFICAWNITQHENKPCTDTVHATKISHNVEQKKSDTTEYTRFDSFHKISKTRRNCSMLLKFRIEVTFWVVVTKRVHEGVPGLLAILLIVLGADCMHVFCCETSLTCLSTLCYTSGTDSFFL